MRIQIKGLILLLTVVFLLACTLMAQAPQAAPMREETISVVVNTMIAQTQAVTLPAPTEVFVPTATASDIPAPLPTLTASPTLVPTLTAAVIPTKTPPPPSLGPFSQFQLPTPRPDSGSKSAGEFGIAHAQMVPCRIASHFCGLNGSYDDPAQVALPASDAICLFWLEVGGPATLGGAQLVTVEVYRDGSLQVKQDLAAMGNYICRTGLISPVSPGNYETKLIYGLVVLSRGWTVR